ncbi:MAG: hypothetical protein E6H07_15575 [Bacteroidetes bacterium]|nr:MAG: hypothetical protein E6H07_15575 [Bacteroidota bacterium]
MIKKLPILEIPELDLTSLENMQSIPEQIKLLNDKIIQLYAISLALRDCLHDEDVDLYNASYQKHFSALQLTVAPSKDDEIH